MHINHSAPNALRTVFYFILPTNLHDRDHYTLIYTDEETEAQRFKYHAQGHVPKRSIIHPNALSPESKGQQSRLSEEPVSYWLNQLPHHMPSANSPEG